MRVVFGLGFKTHWFRFLFDVSLGGLRFDVVWWSRNAGLSAVSKRSGLDFFWTCFLVGFVEKASFPLQSNQGLHTLRFRFLLDVFLGGFRGKGFLPVAKQSTAPHPPV